MRHAMWVALALLLCAGTAWSKVDAEARKANREITRQIQQYWQGYLNALEGVYLGHAGCWHRLSIEKVFLQKALNDAGPKVDRRDPGSARQLDTLRMQVEEAFRRQEAKLRDDILGLGDRKLQPERKE